MRFDRAAWPFVGGALALGFALGEAVSWIVGAPILLLAGCLLLFFRDPSRHPPSGDDIVLSPADGEVKVAGEAMPDTAPPGTWKQVSIFLSPMDVHVNRIPASGRITRVTYKPGRFLPAYRHDAGRANERSEIWIDHHGQAVVARQIVGFLARRVVCRVAVGADVRAGDKFGIMKFGSRMDVFLPENADILVKVGDMVRGGETVIAVLHS
jgi:phosphatidylserine decarboxylase